MKITLEPFREGDAGELLRIANREEVVRWLPDFRMTLTLAERLVRDSRETAFLSPLEQRRLFGIYGEGKLLGALSLGPTFETDYRPAVGFFLSGEAEGKGAAFRAVSVAEELLRREGGRELFALCEETNLRASRLLETLGFVRREKRAYRMAGEREKRRYDLWERTLD